MSVTYDVNYKIKGQDNLRVYEYEDVACFGALRDIGNHLSYINDIPKSKLEVDSVTYYLQEYDISRSAAVAWWEYLVNHRLFGMFVTDYYVGEDTPYVTVSAEATPHHLLNTLSMFRKTSTYYKQVELWHKLVLHGMNSDAACIVAMLSGDGLTAGRHDQQEHVVFSLSEVSVERAIEYIHNPFTAPPKYAMRSNRPYREVMSYVRNYDGFKKRVTGWLFGYKNAPKEDDLLVGKLYPARKVAYYNKETKVVERVALESIPYEDKDIPYLIATWEKLLNINTQTV